MAAVNLIQYGFFDGAAAGNGGGSRVSVRARGSAPFDWQWNSVSNSPFDRFGRLDALCKCAIIAVEMVGLPSAPEGGARHDMALMVGTEHGSFDVDRAFLNTIGQVGGASPALFPYTLPSAALAEIAIRHRITGPNACFVAGPDSGALALWQAYDAVEDGQAQSALSVGCDALSYPDGRTMARSYAFLLEAAPGGRPGRAPLAELDMAPCSDAGADAAGVSASGDACERLVEFLAKGADAKGPRVLSLSAPCVLGSNRAICVRRLGDNRG